MIVKTVTPEDQQLLFALIPFEKIDLYAPLIERHITLDILPKCRCCGVEMSDSSVTEESEYLTKIPGVNVGKILAKGHLYEASVKKYGFRVAVSATHEAA